MLFKKQPIINSNGKQTRDFVFIDDVIEANILAMESNKIGIFNIGTAKETDINTIFKKLKGLTGSKCKEIHGPEKLGEQKRSCLDLSKAKKELGWQPRYNLEAGLKKTVEWFKKYEL
jgi:UDP-glucose 4-epimerase